VNESPEAGGWFVKLKLSDRGELDALLDEEGYRDFIETL
jgi:glycine cleavage system H protein